jgi:prolyl-tRNA synthetase
VLVRRDTKEKRIVSLDALADELATTLDTIQREMLAAARERLARNSIRGDITYDRFRQLMDGEGGFVYAGWNGRSRRRGAGEGGDEGDHPRDPDAEFQSPERPTRCMVTGQPAKYEVVWAKAY